MYQKLIIVDIFNTFNLKFVILSENVTFLNGVFNVYS